MRFPIAFLPGHSHLAIRFVDDHDRRPPGAISDEKSRPAMIDVPSARIMSALATLN
jgi:hypothetical protein